jgi:hypothetical protein
LLNPPAYRFPWRAVFVARELGPLQEFSGGDHAVKLPVVYKIIFPAAHFSRPGASSSDGNGNPDLRTPAAEFRDDRALPDP